MDQNTKNYTTNEPLFCRVLKQTTVKASNFILSLFSSFRQSREVCYVSFNVEDTLTNFLINKIILHCTGVQGWRLPPMWPGFDSQTRRHMWVEFVGSLLCNQIFFSGYSGFPSPQKPTFDLICFNCYFQFTVSPISAPALERLDT